MEKKIISVQITAELKKRIDEGAKKKHLKASDILRLAVIEWLEKNNL